MSIRIENIAGIKLTNPDHSIYLADIEGLLQIVRIKETTSAFPEKMTSVVKDLNKLISDAGAQCTLDAPPADVGITTKSSGALIYRCYHNPFHEWDLIGNPIP